MPNVGGRKHGRRLIGLLPDPTALKRMMAAMVEVFCDSFEQVPWRIVLDIDDTEDRVHGGQQLALFNTYYDSRCFQPIHIYEASTGKPVAIILRPGKTPDGAEVTLVLRHVIGRIRARWPAVDIVVRGDSHYARAQAIANASASATSSAWPAIRCCFAGSVISPRMPHSAGSTARPTRSAATANSATRDKLEGRTPCHRPCRGRTPGRRQPLHRHQLGRPAQGALRKGLLCEGTGREPDQGAQAAPRLRPHLVHQGHRQPVPPGDLRGLAPRTSFWRDAQFDTIRLCLIKVAGRVTEMVTDP